MPLGPKERAAPNLLRPQRHPGPGCQRLGNGQVTILIGNQERRMDPKSIGKRKFLLRGLLDVHIIVDPGPRPVAESLPHKTPAVAGRIEHDVVRTRLEAAFQGRFQGLVLRLVFFKREIVHKKDEPLAPAPQEGQTTLEQVGLVS